MIQDSTQTERKKNCRCRFLPIYSISMVVVGTGLFGLSRTVTNPTTAFAVSNMALLALLIAAVTTLFLDRPDYSEDTPEITPDAEPENTLHV